MNYQNCLKLLLVLFGAYSGSSLGIETVLKSTTVVLYKDYLFCNKKVVVNWKQDFEVYCPNDNLKRTNLMTDRESKSAFVIEVQSYIQKKRYAKDSQHTTSVALLRDKVLMKELDRCIKDKKCRVQRKARAVKE